jgi:lipopolysaccharide transport system ATP-binding protein
MPRVEIDRKFDEIVAFSEIEKFIDTPVKHYSSGMSVRLAFAVAAHLEPEILIIDEVLAVGDMAFQQKSLGKMDDVAKSGRTVLFVSHTMSTVQALCTRAILLQNGQVTHDGPTDEVVREYLGGLISKSGRNSIEDDETRSGSGVVRFTQARVLNEAGDVAEALVAGKPAWIELDYENLVEARRAYFAMTIYNHLGIAVTNMNTELTDFVAELSPKGTVRCYVPNLPLPIGQYRIAGAINVNGKVTDLVPSLVSFDVSSSTFYESSRVANIKYCAVMVDHRWEHEDVKERV